LIDAAKCPPRGKARFALRQALCDELIGQEIEMRLHLVIQPELSPAPPHHVEQSQDERAHD
jgi:hypothetical protein